ncbi:hypothetical protein Ahy_A03g013325 [Arachis hypogaea]|uniref:Uncharacterized protein n=1 Tax=Arachis hypogaea TaxID=3818 RepID=A0A445DVB9_ARAHY|nr:hypothetical protein Ahy_A03g013325 [Arachis hypogaea]
METSTSSEEQGNLQEPKGRMLKGKRAKLYIIRRCILLLEKPQATREALHVHDDLLKREGRETKGFNFQILEFTVPEVGKVALICREEEEKGLYKNDVAPSQTGRLATSFDFWPFTLSEGGFGVVLVAAEVGVVTEAVGEATEEKSSKSSSSSGSEVETLTHEKRSREEKKADETVDPNQLATEAMLPSFSINSDPILQS